LLAKLLHFFQLLANCPKFLCPINFVSFLSPSQRSFLPQKQQKNSNGSKKDKNPAAGDRLIIK
jgi:hypothetical protein